jgi:L,D-transpeptidase-like protein
VVLSILAGSASGAGGAATLADAGAAPAAHAVETAAVASRVLSDERTLSRWAYPVRQATVRTSPSTAAAHLGHLRFVTENGSPELYLTLEQRVASDGAIWIRVRLPGRPNGRTGWVLRDALGPFRVVQTFLLVNRRTLRLTLYRSGRPVFRAPIGVGKPATPTPAGRFWIRDKFKVKGAPFYGPRAIGTSAYARVSDWPGGDVVGLHGTSDPGLVPGRPSHGCIRLRNGDILRLYGLVPRGTPVQIV